MDIQKKFIDACKVGDFDTVKSLLDNAQVNPVDDNNLAIKWASKNRHLNVVKLLLGDKRVKNAFNIDNINYIKKYCSKEINDFYKNYFNLYKNYNIFLLINIICDTTIKLSINYPLPKQLKNYILHYYVYNYRKNL